MTKRLLLGLLLVLSIFTLVGCGGGGIEVNSEQQATKELLTAQSELANIESLIVNDKDTPVKISVLEGNLTKAKERIDACEKYTISDNVKGRYDETLELYEEMVVKVSKLKAAKEKNQ